MVYFTAQSRPQFCNVKKYLHVVSCSVCMILFSYYDEAKTRNRQKHCELTPDREVIKLYPCSTQLSMQFKLLINTEVVIIICILPLNHQIQWFILLINIRMPAVVCILTFTCMNSKNFNLKWVDHVKSFILKKNIRWVLMINCHFCSRKHHGNDSVQKLPQICT